MDTEDKKKVLIVDDEEDMIWSLQKNLPNENLQVDIVTASSGEQALTVIEDTQVDLIVTDIRMPGISGIDLLIAVRNSHPEIGVIVMTAFPSSESKAEVIEKGGLRFIEKPFDIKEMRDSIREALRAEAQFEGKMMGIQLIDIVQINSLSKASTALRVNGDGREGVIYFSEGDIVHAAYDDLVGEEAFYEIMRFQGGKIDTFYPERKPPESIRKPTGALLLKGALVADEMGVGVDYLQEMNGGQEQELLDIRQPEIPQVDETEAPAALFEPEIEEEHEVENRNHKEIHEDDVEADPVSESNSPAEMHNDDEEEENMEELNELLNEFTNIPGVNTACLVGRDGFLLHSVALAGIDAEMIGAIASSGFGASEAMGKQLEKGSMSMTMVEYANGPVMFAPVGSEAFLVIIADKEANLGMIRLKIKKHSREIEEKAGI